VAASDGGTVVYQGSGAGELNRGPIVLIDRAGARSPLIDPHVQWTDLAFSPDGTQLAFDAAEAGKARDVEIFDRRNETVRRLTFDPTDDVSPVWSPDGRRVAFGSKRENARGFFNLYWQNADGSGSAQRLTTADAHHLPGSWSPDGRWIAFHEIRTAGAGDILVLPVESDSAGGLKAGPAQPLVATPATELAPVFSPDGRWIAYFSNESGRDEVYVRPFPGPGGLWQVSGSGGVYPAWSPTKPELLYASREQQVMVARYAVTGGTFRSDKPEPWPGAELALGQFRRFSVAPDGLQIAAGVTGPSVADASLTVVLNIVDEIRRLTAR
jgi:serine/threonine-protein kinase